MVRPDRNNPKHHFFGRGGIANILREGSTCTALLEKLKDLYNSDEVRQSEKRGFVKERVYDYLKHQGGEFFVVQQDSRDKTSMSRDEILDAAAGGAEVCTESDALAKLMQSLRDTKKMKVTPSGKKSFSSGGPRGRPRKYTLDDGEDGGSTINEEDKNTKSNRSRSAATKAKTKATAKKKKEKTESPDYQKQQYHLEEEAEGYGKAAALASSSSSSSSSYSRNKKRSLPEEADEIQMAAASLKRMISSGSGENSRQRKIVKLTPKNPRESLMKHRLDKILNANTHKTAAASASASADSSNDDNTDDPSHHRIRNAAVAEREKEKETSRRPRKKVARAAASSTKSLNKASMCSLCGGGTCQCEILDVSVPPTRRSGSAVVTSSPSTTASSRGDSDREGGKQQHTNSSGRPRMSRNGSRNKNEQDRDPVHDGRGNATTINTSTTTAPDTLEAAQRRVQQLEEQVAELTELHAAQRRIQQQNDEIKQYKLKIEEQNDTIEQQRQHNQQLQRRIRELELEKGEEQQTPSSAVSVSV